MSTKGDVLLVLTPEQEIARQHAYDEALRWGLSTDRADRPRAEAAITEMYRLTGQPVPQYIWCDSPATCLEVISRKHLQTNLYYGKEAYLIDSLYTSLRASVMHSLHASLGAGLEDSLWASLQASLWDSLQASLQASLWDSLWDSLGASFHASLGQCRSGQYEVGWITYYRYCGGLPLSRPYPPERAAELELWQSISESAGCWWPYKGLVVISERPTTVRMELRRADRPELRLHCADGPALAFADGYALYAWHGVCEPKGVILNPEAGEEEDI